MNNILNNKENNLDTLAVDLEWFKKSFFMENKTATEEDFNNIFKNKKGILYIDFNEAANYKIPNGVNYGQTILKKRKITGQKTLGRVNLLKGRRLKEKSYRYYESLNATGIGLIPVNNNGYIVLCRNKITAFTIIFPLILIRMLIYAFLKF